MGESDTLPRVSDDRRGTRLGDNTPWWVAVAFKAIAVLGIPGIVLGFYMYKDYKFEEKRLDIERQRIAVHEKTNVLFERIEWVLRRVEKKLPAETVEGGNR